MKIVHRHHHEWLMYNHAWDPISGSALVDQPSPNPEARSCCQKAGFAASTAYHLKTYHCTDFCHHWSSNVFIFFTNPMVCMKLVEGGKDSAGLTRLMADAASLNPRCTAALCNLTIFSNTEILMLSCANNILALQHRAVFSRVCLWRLGSEWVCD